MKTVIDRLVQYANRYKLTNAETGEVLGVFDFEEVTGTVQQVGTEINKELFDSIATDLAACVKLSGGELANTIVTFSDIPDTAANVASGDKSAVLWGKVKNWFGRLKALAFKSKVAAGDIEAGAIKDADVSASAAIAQSKIAGLTSDYVASIEISGRTLTFKSKSGATIGTATTQDTTYGEATGKSAGLMSAADKAKLDGIAAGAQPNAVTSVAGKTGAVTLVKGDVGLGSVDNTSDAAKPVSTAQAAAIADAKKAGTDAQATANAHIARKDNPHGLTKSQIGLGNVDNTSDMDKPVSTAQAAAIAAASGSGGEALKAVNEHIENKENPHGTTAAQIGLSNVANERQYSAQNPPPYPVVPNGNYQLMTVGTASEATHATKASLADQASKADLATTANSALVANSANSATTATTANKVANSLILFINNKSYEFNGEGKIIVADFFAPTDLGSPSLAGKQVLVSNGTSLVWKNFSEFFELSTSLSYSILHTLFSSSNNIAIVAKKVTPSSTGVTSISFGYTFTNNPVVVTTYSGDSNTSNFYGFILKGSITKTGFQAKVYSGNEFYFIAIGKKS